MKNHKFIEDHLHRNVGDIEVEYFNSISSTNDYILNKNFTHKYHLCYADTQTKGKGQRGSEWISKGKDNIYATLGFSCDFSINQNTLSGIKVAIGVLKAIRNYIPVESRENLKIKLPNDIYYKDQKLAGILIETKNIKKSSFDVIIGVGINVNMFELDEKIDRLWTSLAIIRGQAVDSANLLVSMIIEIIKSFSKSIDETLETFAKYDYVLNRQIAFNYGGQIYKATAKGISNNLKLILESEDMNKFEVDIASISKIRVIENEHIQY
ncbi:biotin--[acetyl-CoA-carboxylase] ligase [Allofrancisella guangzhouensis]|uniref:Biotin--acetyl-CoA-carboxylase ligase n=1 Tax=Allofrancisella guangzhouensis TaxID=594679 RepID=A0A0A8EB42_9GAMM|nr:biotin--[acetyl-CoA-carboxylase] ligase [Allofrancisella guangzhouensis]AJC49391.1 biotin--acetyl-CoA-carboxylase ligase [Allofrancisella guangzhouensis]MBK2026880.1 biotin--[acetyl-CoA-carboxylase] ligase [Allofrancisella guangzhouensis]MBK2044600.1 biotin--[acetyl-CoA-carboxylase] ligase [Allofrancisella guangzhouensis]MBK2045388.1 biotin--[acetyl-CoA-carboxylase] ligase [Allofrancisella guangzhouensis]